MKRSPHLDVWTHNFKESYTSPIHREEKMMLIMNNQRQVEDKGKDADTRHKEKKERKRSKRRTKEEDDDLE